MTRLLSIIIILTGIVVAVFNAPPPVTSPAANIWTSSPATPLMPPLVFGHSYLWHPDGENEFVYQSLTQDQTVRHSDLAGTPVKWEAIPVLDTGLFHIIWLNNRDELWHAQINRAGEFTLRPVRLAEASIIHFEAAALNAGGAIVLWQSSQDFARPVTFNILDATGRPRFPFEILPDASSFDVVAVGDNVHIAWTSSLNAEVLRREYDLEQLMQRAFDVETDITPINIPADRWLTDFELVSNGDEIMVIYGTQSTDHPETVGYQILTDDGVQPLEVGATALRWLEVRENQITVAARMDGKWRAGIIEVAADGHATVHTVGDAEADGSPVSYWENENEEWSAGWATLNGNGIEYHVVSNWQERETNQDQHNWSVIWLAGVWLIVGLGIGALNLEWTYERERLFLLLAYWTAKAGTAVWWLDEQTVASAMSLLLISAVAIGGWYAARQRYQFYFGLDAVLTILWVLLT